MMVDRVDAPLLSLDPSAVSYGVGDAVDQSRRCCSDGGPGAVEDDILAGERADWWYLDRAVWCDRVSVDPPLLLLPLLSLRRNEVSGR